ncbi:Uncharacterised protein [Burkholderia pseudomallei]|nr:Uncharacterised protein [Burkholderia pseudomallei]
MRVALGVEAQHVVERVIDAVVEERLLQRDVTQRRRAEQPAELVAPLQVPALGPACAEVVKIRIPIHRERAIARHAERDQAEIAELRRRAVEPAPAHVTARAVALLLVVEDLQPVQLGARQPRAARQVRVVLARVRIEHVGRLLERAERLQHRLERRAVVVEHARAERRAKRGRVRRGPHGARDLLGRAVHLERRRERRARLLGAAVHAAVPREPARRAGVDALVALVVRFVIVLAERGHLLQVFERRHGAKALLAQIVAAELRGQRVRRPERVLRAVARRAGELAAARQRRIEEQLPAERRHLLDRLVHLRARLRLTVDDGGRGRLRERRGTRSGGSGGSGGGWDSERSGRDGRGGARARPVRVTRGDARGKRGGRRERARRDEERTVLAGVSRQAAHHRSGGVEWERRERMSPA